MSSEKSQNKDYVLTICVGNANVLFGIFEGGSYLGKWRIESRIGRTADEYGVWLLSVLAYVNLEAEDISGVVIACCVPGMETSLVSMCRRFLEKEPLMVLPGVKTGVLINYGRAGDLGPDRLANIVALANIYAGPAVLVDFGMMTSIDVIAADGAYAGGLLAPGVHLALSTLADKAPQLPGACLEKPEKVIGKTIIHSMQSGCFWGAVDMVEGLLRRITAELGVEKCQAVATGGYAKDMLEGTHIFDNVDTNLTLKGLQLIYERNR